MQVTHQETIRDGRKPEFVELPEPDLEVRSPRRGQGSSFIAQEPPQSWHHAVCPYPEYAEKVITIRDGGHHGVVGAMRIVAADTKRSRYRLGAFVAWAVEVIRDGHPLLVVDLFPPAQHDPEGIHKTIWDQFIDSTFALPIGKTATLASYLSRPVPEAYVDVVAIGDDLPDAPLFFANGLHVTVPLEAAYRDSWNASPKVMRAAVETGVMPEIDAD